MKKIIAIVIGCLLVTAMTAGGIWWKERRDQATCLNQMRQWDAAAESFCLAENHGPADILHVEDLAPYVKGGMKQAICPKGTRPYAPFTVANGPVCPNGHDIAPGVPRPFRAQAVPGDKLAGINEAAGWTNLIDKAE